MDVNEVKRNGGEKGEHLNFMKALIRKDKQRRSKRKNELTIIIILILIIIIIIKLIGAIGGLWICRNGLNEGL